MATPQHKTHSIGGTDDLLLSVIKDQASNIEHGWREAITNGVDAPNSERVEAWFDEERSIITDDGDGCDLSSDTGAELLTNMAASSKDRDDDTTIGQFGIGKGQIIAKGRTTFISHGTALHFDINEWGINNGVYETTIDDAVGFLMQNNEEWANYVDEAIDKHAGGMTVVAHHYEDETPSAEYKWEQYQDNVCDRYTYIGMAQDVDVVINGDEVTETEIQMEENDRTIITSEHISSGGTVYIGLKHNISGEIDVYSNGVYVKSISRRGFSGVIVTDKNLDLNFARNEIKSGCTRWKEIDVLIDEIALEICENLPTERLNKNARKFVVDQIRANNELIDEWYSEKIFKMTNESTVSLEEIEENGEVAFNNGSNNLTDGIMERENTVIIDTSDEASRHLENSLNEHVKAETFDIEGRGESHNLTNTHEKLDDDELKPRQYQRKVVAMEIVRRADCLSRHIHWGESDTRHAWTDGSSYIVLTDSCADSSTWMGWVPQLFQTVIHELGHTENTLDTDASHGSYFNRQFRQRMEENMTVLSNIQEEINDMGIRAFVEKYE